MPFLLAGCDGFKLRGMHVYQVSIVPPVCVMLLKASFLTCFYKLRRLHRHVTTAEGYQSNFLLLLLPMFRIFLPVS